MLTPEKRNSLPTEKSPLRSVEELGETVGRKTDGTCSPFNMSQNLQKQFQEVTKDQQLI
jgi:hypothetical protein